MRSYLGQHFLKNKIKLRKIVEALDLKSGDVVIEIGPGKGALTFPLIEKCKELNCKIIAIEKDKYLVNDLRSRIYDLGIKNIEIIEGDVLKILKFYILNLKSYKIVGNIPYYITGYLFRILGELENKPKSIVLLIQKEVAERVCAKKGEMNLLAASVQFWAEPKIIGYVSKNDFSPPPKVESAIIKLTTITLDMRSSYKCYGENYYKFIKILFKQPRKTILNNLEAGFKKNDLGFKNYDLRIEKKEIKEKIIEKLRKIGIDPNARPQDLDISDVNKIIVNFSRYFDF